MLVDKEQKAQAFFAHFDVILGNYEERACSLDFQLLGIPQLQLTGLNFFLQKKRSTQMVLRDCSTRQLSQL
jgi:hypothetical protein